MRVILRDGNSTAVSTWPSEQFCFQSLHVYSKDNSIYNQGGRSWLAFGERKKCLQFIRRLRICYLWQKTLFRVLPNRLIANIKEALVHLKLNKRILKLTKSNCCCKSCLQKFRGICLFYRSYPLTDKIKIIWQQGCFPEPFEYVLSKKLW